MITVSITVGFFLTFIYVQPYFTFAQSDQEVVNRYLDACFNALQAEIGNLDNPGISQEKRNEMAVLLSNCDHNVLYYKGLCESGSSGSSCANGSMDKYITIRGLQDRERPTDLLLG